MRAHAFANLVPLAALLGLTSLVTLGCSSSGSGGEPSGNSQSSISGALRGMNVDPAFGSGPGTTAYPSVTQLGCVGVTRVRFVLKVAPGVTGSTLDEALAFYDNVVGHYRGGAIELNVILNGETVSGVSGPGPLPKGYIPTFAQAAGKIAAHYKGSVHGYEIWNEQDDPATFVNPTDYFGLFAAAHDAIRGAGEGSAKIVVGGLDSGDPAAYLAQMGGALAGDAVVALHPYVHWPESDPVENPGWPTYEDVVQSVRAQTSAPLWFTEWGDDQNGRNAKLVAATFGDNGLLGTIDESYYFSWHDAQKPGHAFGVVGTTSMGDEFKPDMVNAFRSAAGLTGPHPVCGGPSVEDAGADADSGVHSHDSGTVVLCGDSGAH